MVLALTLGSLLWSATPAWAARYIVKMKSGSSLDSTSRRLVGSTNARALSTELSSGSAIKSRAYGRFGIVVVAGEKADIDATLKDHPLVDYYEKDVEWKLSSASAADSPASQASAPWMADFLNLNDNAPDPNVVYGGTSPVIVAVIDTGATTTHPYLQSGLAVNLAEANGAAGTDDDGNGYVDDIYGGNVLSHNGDTIETTTDHGTHVSGIVKAVRDQAIANSFGEAVAVEVLPVRFISASGVGSTSAAIDALDYALARGAKVVNASWGAKGTESFSRALYDTMVTLYNQDVFFAVAAGNSEGGVQNNNDTTPYFPANFNIPGLMSVASLTPTYSVGGTLRDFSLSSFSNYGKTTVDIAAPGDYIDGLGGIGMWSTNAAYPNSSSSPYIRKRGTSMATPVVAGIAGVVRAINRSLTNYEVKQLIVNSATVTSKMSQIRSSAMVDARAAFNAARTAVSHGDRPAAPGMSVQSADAGSQSDSHGGGGCGTLRDIKNQEGFLGGNSLALLASIYLAFALTKKWLRFAKRASLL
ncbi:MAG: S8 family serine peptidase [Bdellovibrionales bacterium]|nr:S8 family serine peptidase [Bdellovibrionales bacterium]